MKVQPTNQYDNQTFNAKLGSKTLMRVANEFERTPQGNQELFQILKKVSNAGSKKTTIELGGITSRTEEVCYNGSAAYDYMDSCTYDVTVRELPVVLTNSLLPGSEHKTILEVGANDTVGSFLKNFTIDGLSRFVESIEIGLFKEFADNFKNKNPKQSLVEELNKSIDFIKSGFKSNQVDEMLNIAAKKDKDYFEKNIKSIDSDIENARLNLKKLESERASIVSSQQKSEEISKNLSNNTPSSVEIERQKMLDQFAY